MSETMSSDDEHEHTGCATTLCFKARDRDCGDDQQWSNWTYHHNISAAKAAAATAESSDDDEEEEEAAAALPTTLREILMTEKAAMQPTRDLGFKYILEAIKGHIVGEIRECILGEDERRLVFLTPITAVYYTSSSKGNTTRDIVQLYTDEGNIVFSIPLVMPGGLNLAYVRSHQFPMRPHMDAILSELAENDFAVTFENDGYGRKQICVSW